MEYANNGDLNKHITIRKRSNMKYFKEATIWNILI